MKVRRPALPRRHKRNVLALPPDTADSFVREVDENLRRDQMAERAKRYGGLVVGALALFLVLLAQAAVGIAAVVLEMPLHVALFHQFGAAVAMWVAVVHLRDMTPSPIRANAMGTA